LSAEIEFTGTARYDTRCMHGPSPLTVAVKCAITGLDLQVMALFDTGAQWCMLRPEIARRLGYSTEPDGTTINTRFGKLSG
jgi:Aspartyl protease